MNSRFTVNNADQNFWKFCCDLGLIQLEYESNDKEHLFEDQFSKTSSNQQKFRRSMMNGISHQLFTSRLSIIEFHGNFMDELNPKVARICLTMKLTEQSESDDWFRMVLN